MPRPRSTPIANQSLADRIAETGKTYAAIAAVIQHVTWESGGVTCCTGASLGKWLNGAAPQANAVPAVVEAFARLLDRPELSASELGWPGHPATTPDDPWIADPVAYLAQLGRDDMLNRRTALTAGFYSLA